MQKINIFVLVLLLLLFCTSITGCFGTKPKIIPCTKPAPPIETFEEREATRQAIQITKDLVILNKASDTIPILDSLQVKYGKPIKSINPTEENNITNISKLIRSQVKLFRKKWNAWLERSNNTDYYLEIDNNKEKTTIQKLKSWAFWTIITLIIWAVIAPTSLVFIYKRIKLKVKNSLDILEEELKKKENDISIKEKTIKQVVKSVETIKAKDREIWEKMKPYMAQDEIVQQEVQKYK